MSSNTFRPQSLEARSLPHIVLKSRCKPKYDFLDIMNGELTLNIKLLLVKAGRSSAKLTISIANDRTLCRAGRPASLAFTSI